MKNYGLGILFFLTAAVPPAFATKCREWNEYKIDKVKRTVQFVHNDNTVIGKIVELPGVDSESFGEAPHLGLSTTCDLRIYGRDKNSAFFNERQIPDARGFDFMSVGGGFSISGDKVFHDDKRLKKADAKTFTVWDDNVATDHERAYFATESFKIETFRDHYPYYVVGPYLLCRGAILPGANPKKFTRLEELNYGTDSNSLYNWCTKTEKLPPSLARIGTNLLDSLLNEVPDKSRKLGECFSEVNGRVRVPSAFKIETKGELPMPWDSGYFLMEAVNGSVYEKLGAACKHPKLGPCCISDGRIFHALVEVAEGGPFKLVSTHASTLSFSDAGHLAIQGETYLNLRLVPNFATNSKLKWVKGMRRGHSRRVVEIK